MMDRKARTFAVVVIAVAACCLVACSSAPEFTDMTFAGQTVSADVLQEGWEGYTLSCRACHGDDGDGRGPAAPGLRPPPRDFRQALFKFGWVTDGLPRDEDLERIILDGLHGTAMLEWDVDRDVGPIVQYLKTFSPEWVDEFATIGEPVVPSEDEWWQGKTEEAIAHGNEIYHGLATCWSCHPAYVTREEISQATQSQKGIPTTSFRPNLYFGELKASEYQVLDKPVKIMPPDFTFQPIRAMREGNELDDLYKIIGSGIPGTAMPTWKGSIPEKDLWALVYYVKYLIDLRDTPEGEALRKRLLEQDRRAELDSSTDGESATGM